MVPEARDLAIEFMDDSVIVINRRFRVLDVNPAAQALFGLKAVEVIGRDLNDYLPLTAELRAGISQPERFQQDIVLQRNGQDVQFEYAPFAYPPGMGDRPGDWFYCTTSLRPSYSSRIYGRLRTQPKRLLGLNPCSWLPCRMKSGPL